MEPVRAIYFEKQVARLCGVHCLNSLLQGSYFTEVDLASVALELDRQEKKLMMEMGTDTPEFLKYMAEDSGNVADSGDYSIQVLQQALSGFELRCVPVTNPEANDALANPLKEAAFICNLSDHWFTIRKCGEKWYNLNSLNKHPELLSDFYLSLYLATLVEQGWSIFVVRGSLPPVTHSTITSEGGEWIPIDKCTRREAPPKAKKLTGNEQDELAAAIALSLATGAPLSPSLSSSLSSAPSSIFDPSFSSPSPSSSSTSTTTTSSSSSFNFPSSSSSSPPSSSSFSSSPSKPKIIRNQSDSDDDENEDAALNAALEASELEAAIAASLRKD